MSHHSTSTHKNSPLVGSTTTEVIAPLLNERHWPSWSTSHNRTNAWQPLQEIPFTITPTSTPSGHRIYNDETPPEEQDTSAVRNETMYEPSYHTGSSMSPIIMKNNNTNSLHYRRADNMHLTPSSENKFFHQPAIMSPPLASTSHNNHNNSSSSSNNNHSILHTTNTAHNPSHIAAYFSTILKEERDNTARSDVPAVHYADMSSLSTTEGYVERLTELAMSSTPVLFQYPILDGMSCRDFDISGIATQRYGLYHGQRIRKPYGDHCAVTGTIIGVGTDHALWWHRDGDSAAVRLALLPEHITKYGMPKVVGAAIVGKACLRPEGQHDDLILTHTSEIRRDTS